MRATSTFPAVVIALLGLTACNSVTDSGDPSGPSDETLAPLQRSSGDNAIDSIVITNQNGPLGGRFPIGGTLQLRATAYYSNSSVQTITDSATWASSTSAISVNRSGLAKRTRAESAFVSATYRGKRRKALLHKACVVLASHLSFDTFDGGLGVARLKVDPGGVVWLGYNPNSPGTGGAFKRVATSGGTVTTIRSGIPYVGQWDMNANYIYWIWVDAQGAQSYYIVRMRRTTGHVDTLFSSLDLGGGSRGLAVDANYIYYAPGNDGGIRRMPVSGGAATAFHSDVEYGPRELTLSGGVTYAVVWDATPHLIMSVAASGTAVDTLGQANAPGFQQVNGSYLYWSEVSGANNHRIARVPKAGGAVTTVATNNNSQGFASTDGFLYYARTNANGVPSIVRSPIGGGQVKVVTDACGISTNTGMRVQYLATDGNFIYFTEDGGGTGYGRVLKVRK
jgi:hypothetical protein